VLDLVAEGIGEDLRSVAGTVVGHDGLDGDPLGGKRSPGPLPEARDGLLAFVGEDL
jgi:hypothetical protein